MKKNIESRKRAAQSGWTSQFRLTRSNGGADRAKDKDTELTAPDTAEKDEPIITPNNIADMTGKEFFDYLSSRNGQTGPDGGEADAEPKQEGGEKIEAEPDAADAETTEQPEGGDAEREQAEDPEPTDGSEPYRVFKTREEYEADINKAVEEALKKRFSNAEKDGEELKRIRRSARGKYRESENPVQAMIDDMDTNAAKKTGQSVEDYRKSLDENDEFEEWKAEKARAERQREQNERIIAGWKREAESLKRLVPEFDLISAMRDPAFGDAIRSGESVAMAYMKMRGSQPEQQKPKRKEITQNAASGRRGTGGGSANPATMPTNDYIAYINRQAGRKLL